MNIKNPKPIMKAALAVCLSAILFLSCAEDEENFAIEKDVSENQFTTAIKNVELFKSESEILSEMKAMSNELYFISTGKKSSGKETGRLENFSVPPPYYAGNTGSVFINNFTSQYDRSDNLSYGNRAEEHTTQWIDLNLTDVVAIRDIGGGAYKNIGRGKVKFDLYGVGQSVTLNYRVGYLSNGARQVTVTPSSSASLYQNNIAPSTISLQNGSGPIRLTVHANEFGYLWLRLTYQGTIKYDQLYRFNYSPTLDSRNGGRITMSGYNRVGYSIPYSVFAAEQDYSGYCGWFKE